MLFPSCTIYIYCLFPWYSSASHQSLVERFVLNMISSAYTIWRSPSSIDWWNLMTILDKFCASLSYFTYILLRGTQFDVDSIVGIKPIQYVGMRLGLSELETMCWGIYFFYWDSKQAIKSPLGLVISIVSVAWYGLSWTCVWNWRNWLGLIRVWSRSGIYKDPWNTRIYFLPVTDVNPVAADTMSSSFMGSYMSKNSATSHDISV